MIQIGLDLAYRSCGICVNKNGSILKLDSFLFNKDIPEAEHIKRVSDYVFSHIQDYLRLQHELIIEDIFMQPFTSNKTSAMNYNVEGFKHIARCQGAVVNQYFSLTRKAPKYIMAISARKNIKDLLTRATKPEIQIYVANFLSKHVSIELQEQVIEERRSYQAKEMCKSTFKKHMDKLSKQLEKETGLDEHKADAVILTLQGGI